LIFFENSWWEIRKATVHLQPLSKEGTFIETRLTTRNTATSSHHFRGSKKKFPKTLRDKKFELPLRPLSREVLYRMRCEEMLKGSPQKLLKRVLNNSIFVTAFYRAFEEADSSVDFDKRSLT